MINFRQKKQPVQDLMTKAIQHLSKIGNRPNIISEDRANEVSSANAKSMVLLEFIKNEDGRYQITLMDKGNGSGGPYPYTQKMVQEQFQMNVLDVNKKKRTITADTEHYGVVMDIIEILSFKYNLSVVQ